MLGGSGTDLSCGHIYSARALPSTAQLLYPACPCPSPAGPQGHASIHVQELLQSLQMAFYPLCRQAAWCGGQRHKPSCRGCRTPAVLCCPSACSGIRAVEGSCRTGSGPATNISVERSPHLGHPEQLCPHSCSVLSCGCPHTGQPEPAAMGQGLPPTRVLRLQGSAGGLSCAG